MPTHLTRLVIRRILSNEPIVYRDCIYRRSNNSLQYGYRKASCNSLTQRRSLFGFSRKPARQVKEADLAPGLEKMFELNHSIGLKARKPPTGDLANAFRKMINAKYTAKEALSDLEVGHTFNTFKIISADVREDMPPWIPTDVLVEALTVLTVKPPKENEDHGKLAERIFEELETRMVGKEGKYNVKFMNEFSKFMRALAVNGRTKHGRDVLLQKFKERGWKSNGKLHPLRPWMALIDGFICENNETELLETLKLMQEHEVSLNVVIRGKVIKFYADRGDMEGAKRWYNEAVEKLEEEEFLPSFVYHAIVRSCLKHNEREWGQSVVRQMLGHLEKQYLGDDAVSQQATAKELWDAVFLWAAGSGKGVDEVERMMHVMVRRTFADGSSLKPDVNTINALVEFCISRNDPYFSERYISLGQKWGIRPNATTYNLQVTYRLSVGDIDGALAAYRQLQGEECSGNEDVVSANKLIQAMCASRKYDFNAIMSLVEDLNERKARFEPETVSVLSTLHLQRNEIHDVIDLLQTHAFHFTEAQRLQVAETLILLIRDRMYSTTRAWDTYIILQSVFDEITRETRTIIMNEFFARGRPDMAYHIFNHMRQLSHPDSKANAETYIAALVGIADAEDAESLELVHNQMKLDLDIDPDTRIRNALMLAYTMCGQPRRALDFWDDIVNSQEGPSYNSILIAFRACEKIPFGERQAKELWERLRKMDIDISKEMFAAYVGALAGNHLADEAKEALVNGEKEFGYKMDAFLLGTLFNASYGMKKQENVEAWIQAKYPSIWVELMRIGFIKTEDGPRLFKIDRSLKP